MLVVAQTNAAAYAVRAIEIFSPDVILLGINFPEAAVSFTEALRKSRPDAKIVILTCRQAGLDIVAAFEKGALAYLFKTCSGQDILTAIRTTYEGRRFVPTDVASRLADEIPRPDLTIREKRVLELIADGLRNKEIAGVLDIAETTVKEHIRHIFSKLQVRDRTAAVITAFRSGIIHL